MIPQYGPLTNPAHSCQKGMTQATANIIRGVAGKEKFSVRSGESEMAGLNRKTFLFLKRG